MHDKVHTVHNEDRARHRHQRREDNGRHSGAKGVGAGYVPEGGGCAAEHKRGLPAADREAGVGDDAHEVQGRHQTGPEPAAEGADSIGHFYSLFFSQKPHSMHINGVFFVFCGLKVLNSGRSNEAER